MKVRALRIGFDGSQRRRPGEVFEFNGPLGKWMEPVDPETPLPPEREIPEDKKPEPVAGTSAAVKAKAKAKADKAEDKKPEPEPESPKAPRSTGDQEVI